MSMTLWPARKNLHRDVHREVCLQNCREILAERLWLPIYEVGGVDALIDEGVIRCPPPPPPRPTMGQKPMSDYVWI